MEKKVIDRLDEAVVIKVRLMLSRSYRDSLAYMVQGSCCEISMNSMS